MLTGGRGIATRTTDRPRFVLSYLTIRAAYRGGIVKAAYYLGGRIEVGDVPDPVPGKGQALVRTHSCGLCASDVHFLRAGEKMVKLSREYGGPYAGLDLDKLFVPGHEYVGEVLDYGPGSRRPVKPGRRVTSVPIMRQSGAHSVIGYHNDCPGGFGEYMLLDEDFIMEVPAGLDDDRAAITEPLAVGLEHARRGAPAPDDVALVVGCGAIGLGVIAGLKLKGIRPIIAADLNAERRAIALRMGADVVIDPRELSPFGPVHELGMRRATLIYECVGVPGLLKQIIGSVGFGARIVMGGLLPGAGGAHGIQRPEQTAHPPLRCRRGAAGHGACPAIDCRRDH